LKDNIDTVGIRTTAASELFKDRVPSEDAEVVRRPKDAGAVFLGKLNLHTTVDVPVPDYTGPLKMEASKLRLGIPRSPFFEELDPEVAKTVEQAIGVLRKITNSVTETKLPPAPSITQIVGPEAYAYHSK
jgi:Asp-tRNA(Asn)/Glu-tRNA(Gln) amidotransferase A subunit family amidase